jgi:hypothetical protein
MKGKVKSMLSKLNPLELYDVAGVIAGTINKDSVEMPESRIDEIIDAILDNEGAMAKAVQQASLSKDVLSERDCNFRDVFLLGLCFYQHLYHPPASEGYDEMRAEYREYFRQNPHLTEKHVQP